jgi:methylated-DNA-protein-cysteine methyltransferase-like protein
MSFDKKKQITDKIFCIVKSIPEGKISTYGLVAKKANIKSPRLVGQILHKNTDPKNIPCHRVVFKNGKVSQNYAFGGGQAQKQRLQSEGIIFKKSGKIDMIRYGL